MSTVLQELINLLKLEQRDTNEFRGKSQDLGFPHLFGGQVLGQGLVAASKTVSKGRVHSLHAYFLRPGDARNSIDYEVDRIRDGRSFTTRRVIALQHGKPILTMTTSFHIQEDGYEHQITMPDVPGPDGLLSELEQARKIKNKIPEIVRHKFTCDRPIEIRAVNPIDYFKPEKRPPQKYHWLRTAGPMPDDWLCHECLLAYASDFGLVGASLLPHGMTFAQKGMQIASLDHAMWFHRPFRIDEWLLYAMDSPSASQSLGLSRGHIFNLDGTLVASVVQEGLIRYRKS